MNSSSEYGYQNPDQSATGNQTRISISITSSSHFELKTLVAGFLAATATTLLLHPCDVIRLTQITQKMSFVITIQQLWTQRSFYHALPISMLSYVATYCIYFPFNNYLKTLLGTTDIHPYIIFTLATIIPSLCSLTICNPVWTIKSQQIADRSLTCRQALRSIYERSGYRGFYKGLLFGYLNSMNGIIAFSLYDIFKDMLRDETGNTATDIFIASISSKTIATVLCYPFFVLRIRHQVLQGSLLKTMRTLTNCQSNIFQGLGISLVQQLPKNTLILLIYEFLMRLM